MAVVTVATKVATTAIRAYKSAKYYGNKYRYLDPTEKFIQKFVPPNYRRAARITSQVLIGGGLLYDIVDLANVAVQKPKPYQNGQTRSNFQSPRRRRVNYSKRGYPHRCSCRRQRRFY